MRVEFVDEAVGQDPVSIFPPSEKFLDLRENPRAVERIAAARRYLPLRNFLTAVNGPESLFTTASATAKSDLPAGATAREVYEFGSQATLVFAESSLNFDWDRFADLRSGLKELLERDAGDAVRAMFRISSCDFAALHRRGFCLGVRLVAHGDSAEQAELRWGLGLARVQQALLFRARVMKQQMGQ